MLPSTPTGLHGETIKGRASTNINLRRVMVETYMNEGCRRSAYAPIVASGIIVSILHYSRNSRRMDAGDVTVMDVGAECDNYASDITRTIPVEREIHAPPARDLRSRTRARSAPPSPP